MKFLNKKGQAEMSETLLVLLVIVVIIVSGIFVYYSFFYRGLGILSNEITDTQNLILLHIFSSLPETKCENDDCVDMIKIFAFKELIKENKAYYFNKFRNKRISLEFIYPEINQQNQKTECSLEKLQQANFPDNCGYITIYDGLGSNKGYIVSLPVSLYFANINEYRIGLLKIEGID